jgi:hypothetical protein
MPQRHVKSLSLSLQIIHICNANLHLFTIISQIPVS